MAKKHVFVSVGTPYAEPQRAFLDALIDLLRSCDIEPRVINKTEFVTQNPLKDISRVMRECDGAIIVAYERTFFDSGLEKRKSEHEAPLNSVRYTTPWNQIEAAMAVAIGLPIIVMVETGLREEGLLEDRYDWYIERLSISGNAFADNAVRGRIMAWCRRVQTEQLERPGHNRMDTEMTLSELGRLLTIRTALTVTAVLFGIFVIGLWIRGTPIGTTLFNFIEKKG
jgi:hypothetical protein